MSKPKIITYYLQMLSANELKAKEQPNDFVVKEAEIKQYEVNRFLYEFIGSSWEWHDKADWSNSEWRAYSERENLKTFIAYHKGSIAGYYELETQESGNVELKYFGLALKFIGKGFGGYLLSHAISSAWSIKDTKRVWVHTCSLDHKNALANYQARGFQIYNIK